MPSLAQFTAFVKSTGEKLATSPDEILNDAGKNTYFINRAIKGKDVSDSVQSGTKITDRIQLTDSGTAQFVEPNEDLDIQNVDNMTKIQTEWRFLADHYAYEQKEIKLNSGNAQTYYKNLLKSKRQACKTSTWNKMEDAIWAAPSNSDMESAAGKLPYSIPAFITTDGLAPSGFTTVETVNPSTNPKWRNQVQEYDPSNVADPNDGVVHAIDLMFMDCKFEAPAGGPSEFFNNDKLQKMVIATNRDGRALLQTLTRDANDRLVPANNLGWVAGNITYAGLPIDYVSTLNDALVNSGAAITTNEPWFYFINLEFLYPIFHSEVYMQEEEPLRRDRQPWSYVVWTMTYYNWFCRSRKRQGLVIPNNL